MRRLAALVLIALLALTPIAGVMAQASPAASPQASPVVASDREISFQSGPDTLYGSLMVPDGLTAPAPGVLIISGSGPTDRNGDSSGLPMGTNRHFAEDFAALGVVTFRYDKLGSGKTGLGTHADGQGIDYDLFMQEAWDAFDVLAKQPEVDPTLIVILGHSEGGLFAIDMATDQTRETRPAGIILAAPLAIRYLDLLREQIAGQYDALVAEGQLTEAVAKTLLGQLDETIAEIRDTGTLTTKLLDPGVQMLLSPANVPFLYQADQRDPLTLVTEVPQDMPVMIIHGAKDEQVTTAQMDQLAAAFEDSGHTHLTRLELPNANHIFQVIEGEPDAAKNYADTSLPFSPEIEPALREYMTAFD
ncbi:MAG TPA: alpha/beta fold hydrolase [Thermomicrobiales bacterium]|nr:alpha/beta fold hydrolase [Thermomicrobiales bacterium]